MVSPPAKVLLRVGTAAATVTQAPVLLVACDVPYPEPLNGVRPVADCSMMSSTAAS